MKIFHAGFSCQIFIAMWQTSLAAQTISTIPDTNLIQRSYSDLRGFVDDETLLTWNTFIKSCASIARQAMELRSGVPASPELRRVCADALETQVSTSSEARQFFESRLQPFEVVPRNDPARLNRAFLTGYYEPIVDGSMNQTAEFSEPLLGKPDDLVAVDPKIDHPGLPSGFTSARRRVDGTLEKYPDRKAIESGEISERARPVVWVRDAIEAFMIHVQGSAAIRLTSGDIVYVTYAGRNGHPYSSIGRMLTESGEIPLHEMSLQKMKLWVRDKGQGLADRGRELLQKNASFIFFSIDASPTRTIGPIGAAGVPLSNLRSIAVDRNIWSYGLPFWIEAELPWEEPGSNTTEFRRLVIALDTGSAIVGAARADLYFGSGDRAGHLAGGIRHYGRMFVLLPLAITPSAAPR